MSSDQRIEIRFLNGEDSRQLVRLAQRDTAELPSGPVLGGIVDGELVAAHSVESGDSIADPFRPTREIRELLASWSKRIQGRRRLLRGRRRDRAARAHSIRANELSAPSVPGSEHAHLLRPRGF